MAFSQTARSDGSQATVASLSYGPSTETNTKGYQLEFELAGGSKTLVSGPNVTTMIKIGVVGATGPIGIHLATELRKKVASVRVIARSSDRLTSLFPEAAVEKWPADVLDADATLRAIEGCDLVYDCIGLPGDQMHLHPVTARNIAVALRHTKARCVQVSSYWAYYPEVRTEMNESHPQRMTSYADGIGRTLTWISSSR